MAYTEFYVTKGSSVADTNGGGPSLGTNDGPVKTNTNCSSDVAGTTITDDDAGGWAGASDNDWICFDTAGSKDFARITNISGNDLTVTPAVTGSASGKTVNVGGAWATVDHATDTVTTSFVNGSSDSPRINIKYESGVAYAEEVDLPNSGTAAIPITIEGYETTAGDRSSNLSLIQPASVVGNGVFTSTSGKDFLVLCNLKVVSVTSHREGFNGVSDYTFFHRLWIETTGGTGHGIYNTGTYCAAILCYADTSGDGFDIGQYATFIACYSKDAGRYGFQVKGFSRAICCIVDTPADDCFRDVSYGSTVFGCVGYKSTAGSGAVTSSREGQVFINNIFAENNQYGIEKGAAFEQLFEDYNAFYFNNQGEVLNVPNRGANDVTLSGDPFTDAANKDFSLDNVAGQGAACRDAGVDGGDNPGHA